MANIIPKGTNLTTGQQQTLTPSDALTAPGTGINSEHYGAGSTAAGTNSLAAGFNASAGGNTSVVLGASASSIGTGNVVVGTSASGGATNCVTVGFQSLALGGTSCITIGHLALASGTGTIVIGDSTQGSTFTDSILLGRGGTVTGDNQFIVGANNHPILNGYLGNGVVNAAPQDTTFNATGGLGIGTPGATFNLAGGVSGDDGTAGGSVKIRTGRTGSATTLTDDVIIDGGAGWISCPGDGTSSERFGNSANTGTGNESLAVGFGASTGDANECVAMGFGAAITAGANSTAIGHNAQGADINVVVGHEAQSTQPGATLVGEFARNSSQDCVAIGWRSLIDTNAANSVAIGDHAHIGINANSSVVVGSNAVSTNSSGNIVIGNFAQANTDIAIAIGQFATGNGPGCIAIGFEASSQFSNTIALGVRGTATAEHQITSGHINQEFTDVYLAGGVNYPGAPFVSYLTAPTTPNLTIHGTNGLFYVALGAPVNPPTLSNTPAGSSLAAGTYNFTYSYRNKDDFGETPLSPSAAITIAAGDSITITPNPTIPSGTASGEYQDINIYLDNPIGSGSNYQQITSTFGGPVTITSFTYGNNNDGVDTTSYDGDGYNLQLAGGEANDPGATGGNLQIYTNLSGVANQLNLAAYFDAATGFLSVGDGALIGSPPNLTPKSTLHVQKCFGYKLSTISTDTNADATSVGYLIDTTGGSVTLTLPDATQVADRIYRVKKLVAANTVTIATAGGNIDNNPTFSWSTALQAYDFWSDGTDWWIF